MQGLSESSLPALIDLFKRLSEAHVHLKGFCYGDDTDLRLWSVRHEAEYPMLFVEMPDESFSGRNVQSVYEFGFAVLYRVGQLDAGSVFASRALSEAYAVAQEIIHDILARLRDMYRDGALGFDITDAKLQPVSTSKTADRAIGFRAGIRLEYQAGLCLDKAKWADLD